MNNDFGCSCVLGLVQYLYFNLSYEKKMISKLYVGLVLLGLYSSLLIECTPIIQGRGGDYSTHPLRENQSQDFQNEDEEGIINKIVAFAAMPLSTAKAFDENLGDLPVANPFELNQNQTSFLVLKTHEAFKIHHPIIEETTSDFHSDFLISPVKSADSDKVSINESLVDAEATTIPFNTQRHIYMYSSKIPDSEVDFVNANQGSDMSSQLTTVPVDSTITTPHNGPVNSFMNGYYSDFEYQHDNVNDLDMEGSMNDDENDEFLKHYDDEDALPSALKNLPHDIPPDRTIYEVLAENIVKDKQYDEFRMEELIHELMDHYDTHNGLGEVYAGEADYAENARPSKDGIIPIVDQIIEESSTASSY